MDKKCTNDTRFYCKTWVRTWMEILHGYLKRLKIQKVIKKGNLTFPPDNINVIELDCKVVKTVANPPIFASTLFFQVYHSFLAKRFVPPLPKLFKGGRERGFQPC